MTIFLHINLEEIVPIGLADAQETLGYVTVAAKALQLLESILGQRLWVPYLSAYISKVVGHLQVNHWLIIAFPT